MQCRDAEALLPRYLDNELSEAEAAPLRAHLLDCPDCRAQLQDARSLDAWFVKPAAVEIPDGFAARVARRAMAGDPGVLVPVPAGPPIADEGDDRLRTFLISAVAVAAVVLLSLSIALRRLEMPGSQGLSADDASQDQAIQALQELNEREETDDPGSDE